MNGTGFRALRLSSGGASSDTSAGAAEQSRKHLGLQFAKFIGLLQELAMYGQKVS
jgi:hypothetical protein